MARAEKNSNLQILFCPLKKSITCLNHYVPSTTVLEVIIYVYVSDVAFGISISSLVLGNSHLLWKSNLRMV